MNRQLVFSYVNRIHGTEPEYPWGDRNAVLRRRDNEKWYGVVLEVAPDKLGLPGQEPVDVLNVKCDPVTVGSLLTQPGFHRAYHMNKERWISIRLDGSVPASQIEALLEFSWHLTAPKKRPPKGA